MLSCRQCSATFDITPSDLAFYEKVSPVFAGKKELIPPPTRCPECRQQRRLAHVNRYHLYRRSSSKSGKEIISIYSPEKDLQVYEMDVWWSDVWDPLQYGRDFNEQRTVFEEAASLFRAIPHMSLFNDSNENCPYVNWTGWAKNCHLCSGVDYSEDVMYSESLYYSRSSLDCLYGKTIERCYECSDCTDSYGLLYSRNCSTCRDSAFLFDCIGCDHCFGCVNLRRRQYQYFNEQLTKEEYEERIAVHFPLTEERLTEIRSRWNELRLTLPHRAVFNMDNENVSGDYLQHCNNARGCFDCTELEDCARCTNVRKAKDCQDINLWGHPGELCYEGMGIGEGAQRILFSITSWGGIDDLLYCYMCIGCQHCFGCAGLRHKQYCVFNKQYTEEEYEKLVPKLIAHMRTTGEWGEFFPASCSLFAYNESLAQTYYPLTQIEARERGWKWREEKDEVPKVAKIIPASQLPGSIDDIPDDIVNWAIECEATKRPFKIIKQELEFYRKMKLPVPRLHPDERHKRRMALRNPRKLWKRQCQKCQKEIQTTYAPERPEIVYCESCYLKDVY